LLKIGIVTQLDVTKALVRVQFTDMDAVVSYWLPVLHHKTLKDKQYWMPDVNEHVVCLLDENGEEGVVLGAIYSDADTVPVHSKDKYHLEFQDGTVIEYDRKAKRLFLDLKGDCNITIQGKAEIKVVNSLEEQIAEWNGMYENVFIKTEECTITGLRCPFTGLSDHP